MTWLQPWAVWFLAGLPVIVLLYLLKVRRRPVSVSTLIFWQRVLKEHRRRALFQRLRHVLSLLLHLLIFALIVGALARPTFDRSVQNGSSTVVILDVRARMQAVGPDGQSRFDKAVRAAQAVLRDASANRQFALLTAGADATVAAPFTGNERTLRTALDQAKATDATGDLDHALALSKDLLASRGGPHRTIVITDAPVGGDVEAISVGQSLDNLAITQFATRPLPASPQTSEILIEIQNFGAQAATTNLELRYDDRLLDVKPVEIPAGGKVAQVFPSVPRPSRNARGWLTAKLDIKDSLSIDNVARAILPPPRPTRVLLVTKSNAFLEKALGADPNASFELIGPDAWSEQIAGKFDVVVYDDFIPSPTPAGSALYIKRTPFDTTGADLELPALTDIDSEHPTLRLIDFAGTTILKAHRMTLPNSDDQWTYTAPLRSFDQPILITGAQRSGKRIAALALDLTATDLPLRVAFPLLVTNTIHWLASTPDQTGRSLVAGGVMKLGDSERIIEPLSTTFFQPLQNGFYEWEHGGRREWIAVNTFSPEESNLRRGESAPPNISQTTRLSFHTPFAAWPLWRWLALGSAALFTMEWSLFHRRRTE